MSLLCALIVLVLATALISYRIGSHSTLAYKDTRRALANAYIDQELLREQLYLMRVAGAATLGAGSSVAARRSHLKAID